ncbi:IS4 family transposase [Kozakia baliensis]|nr:IS4 family transposase [Kozakia baliensis]GEL65816.1 transposase [Kozakia baliensis]
MARTAAVFDGDADIGERLGIATICRSFGREQIEQVLRASGRETRRRRDMPEDLTVYFVIAMALLMHVNIREVLRCLWAGLRDIGHGEVRLTGKSGISQARTRLGSEPLRQLYKNCVGPVATSATLGTHYKDWHLVAMDGSTLDVPDEIANRATFGGPTTYNDRSPFPQIRFVTLAEIGTRVMFGAEMADYATSERELARAVVEHLRPGMLCITDRGFFSFDMMQRIRETGADALLRARKDIMLPVMETLPDGSWRSELNTWRRTERSDSGPSKPIPVRVVRYRLGGVENRDETYTLVTTILDPERAPASDLAALYHERWEIETAFDELKTHLRGARLCLRSKTPELVRQEFHGLMLAHFAIRSLMHEAALKAKEDPDRLSFTHGLRVIRRKIGHMVLLSPSAEEKSMERHPA